MRRRLDLRRKSEAYIGELPQVFEFASFAECVERSLSEDYTLLSRSEECVTVSVYLHRRDGKPTKQAIAYVTGTLDGWTGAKEGSQ